MTKITKGFSLFEMLVVILIMGILGAVTTQIITISLRSSSKSESMIGVRENLNYVVNVIERELRNAVSVSCSSDQKTLTYKNIFEIQNTFSCFTLAGGNLAIASGSAQITTDEINLVSCNFTCEYPETSPPAVNVSLSAQNTDKSSVDTATIDISTKIYLRNY